MNNRKQLNLTGNVKENISWFRIIIGSALLFCSLLFVDIHNVPSIIMYKFDAGNLFLAREDIFVFLLTAAVIAVALLCRSRILSLFRMRNLKNIFLPSFVRKTL